MSPGNAAALADTVRVDDQDLLLGHPNGIAFAFIIPLPPVHILALQPLGSRLR
jgi:hypothetical protein